MTKLWVNNSHTAVTLLEIVPQEVVRYKTSEKDGYEATVIGVGKKELNKEKWQKLAYSMLKEFWCDDSFKSTFPEGSVISTNLLEGVQTVDLTGVSKGKGFSWVMKRFNTKWGPKTHGSKFHRHVWSLGNRKPRRVQKWHPHAGHMGTETITLHNRPIVEVTTLQGTPFVIVKWAVPGSYNGYLSLYVS